MKRHPLTLEQTRALIPQMPFNHHLGFHVARMYKDGLTMECTLRPEMTNGHGTLHGGVTAALIDAAIGVAVIALAGDQPAGTVEMKVNFLRPGLEGRFRCRSRLLKVGKTLAFGEAVVRDSHGRVVATGHATYIYLEESAANWS
ncbi:MAG: PaaI family thioesterase [Bryobacteraceae bacterium]